MRVGRCVGKIGRPPKDPLEEGKIHQDPLVGFSVLVVVVSSPVFSSFVRDGTGTVPLRDATLGKKILDFPFGQRFTELFLEWFRSVVWLDAPGETSLLEIYMSFSMSTGHMAPVGLTAR